MSISQAEQAPLDMRHFNITAEETLVMLAGRAMSMASQSGKRILVGIIGGPASGKSTLAETLRDMLNEMVPGSTTILHMDGYHRKHADLVAHNLVDAKGAPHTFDVEGFLSALEIVSSGEHDFSAPIYSREIEDVVEKHYEISKRTPIVLVEGSYLMLEDEPWHRVRSFLNLSAFLSIPRDVAMRRLIKRHGEHGLFTKEHIHAHIDRTDLPNFDLVENSKERADLIFEIADAR